MALRTDFKDSVLKNTSGSKKYKMTNNSDNTVSFTDVTEYSQEGSSYGAKEVNEEREAINGIRADMVVSLDEIASITKKGKYVDALAVKELMDKMYRKIIYDETETGEIMLGKKVYSKSVWQTHLPNNGFETFDVGLPSDTYYAWIDLGNSYIYKGGYTETFPVPYVNPLDNSFANSVGVKLNANKLIVYTATDWAGYGFFITVKYTKK